MRSLRFLDECVQTAIKAVIGLVLINLGIGLLACLLIGCSNILTN